MDVDMVVGAARWIGLGAALQSGFLFAAMVWLWVERWRGGRLVTIVIDRRIAVSKPAVAFENDKLARAA